MSLWSRRSLQTEAMKRMYTPRSVEEVSTYGGQEEDVHAEVNLEEDILEVHTEVEEDDGYSLRLRGLTGAPLLPDNNDAGAPEYPPPEVGRALFTSVALEYSSSSPSSPH